MAVPPAMAGNAAMLRKTVAVRWGPVALDVAAQLAKVRSEVG
jgi:hypothetical protein